MMMRVRTHYLLPFILGCVLANCSPVPPTGRLGELSKGVVDPPEDSAHDGTLDLLSNFAGSAQRDGEGNIDSHRGASWLPAQPLIHEVPAVGMADPTSWSRNHDSPLYHLQVGHFSGAPFVRYDPVPHRPSWPFPGEPSPSFNWQPAAPPRHVLPPALSVAPQDPSRTMASTVSAQYARGSRDVPPEQGARFLSSEVGSSSGVNRGEATTVDRRPDEAQSQGGSMASAEQFRPSYMDERYWYNRRRAALKRINRSRKQLQASSSAAVQAESSIPVEEAFANLEHLTDVRLRLVRMKDPAVNIYVDTLRSAPLLTGNSIHDAAIKPAKLTAEMANNPQRLISYAFQSSKLAKQATMPGREGARNLFFTFLVSPRFLRGRPVGGYLAAWEVGPMQDDGVRSLFLYGLYPFSAQDFEAFAQHPLGNAKSYWISKARKGAASHEGSFQLAFIRQSEEDSIKKIVSHLEALSNIERTPDIEKLLSTGQLASVLAGSHHVAGLYLFAYQESADIDALIHKWKFAIGHAPGTVNRIALTQDQVENLGVNMESAFRRQQSVKMVNLPNGERLMLQHGRWLRWMKQHQNPVLVVWKMGPFILGRRLLICKGFYDVTAEEWNSMTSQTIPGLYDSSFSYNSLDVR